MEKLYMSDSRMNIHGRELDEETNIALRDIFKKYLKKGYSPREIAHIMLGAVFELELQSVISSESEKDNRPEKVLVEDYIPDADEVYCSDRFYDENDW